MAGEVSGRPGVAYTNRSDLNAQPVRAAAGQPYGQRGAQEAAQRAVPLPGPRDLPTPLGAPSERPDEPLTAGAPFGAGRMSPSLQAQAAAPIAPGSQPDVLRILEEAYRLYPSDDLMDMIVAERMR